MSPDDLQLATLDTGDQLDTEARALGGDPLPNEPMTELGYARRFIASYGDQFRHVPAWHKWYVWDGARWILDSTGRAHRCMKVIARALTLAAQAIPPTVNDKGNPDDKERRAAVALARRGESSAGVNGALTLAATEAEIAIDHGQLDADPFLLNCTNGTLDLRTGELRAHDPADLLTKLTGAGYRPDATSEEFDRFLATIQPEERMRRYLPRLLGHTLEGRQAVHILPIFHGDGANGKGTLVGTVLATLGDYGIAADPDLLTARSFDTHPTGVADLHGRRLAVLHEGDAGRRLAEGTVKRLTGGDRIKARRMREDFWEFEPSHTFLVLTNHKPLVAGTDEGIWRRLRLVPFPVVVPEADRDPELPTRLALQADAILAWLVAGYRDWHEHGLGEPVEVTEATDAYRAESDGLARFIDERCHVAKACSVQSSALFAAWASWCNAEGEHPGTNKAFTTALQNRGFDTRRTKTGAVWNGIGLAAHPAEGDPWRESESWD